MTIEKKNYSVLRLNNNGCGVSCITLSTAFIGTGTAGIKVFSGLNTKEYSHIIDGLIPGIKYFVRISAASIYGIQSPFAFVGYPRTAVGLIPMGPGPISLNESSLRVDFSLPPQRVEGFNCLLYTSPSPRDSR